jgi:CRP-like cAMP-binding protein
MDFKSIISTIEKHITLDDVEKTILLGELEGRTLKAGEFVERAGEPSKYFIFVSMGCLMSYYSADDGVDHVMQFATASWWTGDLHSCSNNAISGYSTRALTDSEVILMTWKGLETLLDKVPKFEKYFRILFQNSLMAHQLRIRQTISSTAEERYEWFRERFPTLEQFVPQKYIASYLGVTPEFLSKIRRRIMNK